MVIVETTIFTKIISSLLTDEDYRKLQNELLQSPSIGKLITGSGGLRKIRWKAQGRGKRGGTSPHFSPDRRALACSLNPQGIFLSRKYTLLFHSFGKPLVNPKPCAIISLPGEKCGLELFTIGQRVSIKYICSSLIQKMKWKI